METQTETTPETIKKTPGLIAVVERFAGPGEPRPVEFIEAPSKREMKERLADKSVASVLGLIKGRRLGFSENRNVSF